MTDDQHPLPIPMRDDPLDTKFSATFDKLIRNPDALLSTTLSYAEYVAATNPEGTFFIHLIRAILRAFERGLHESDENEPSALFYSFSAILALASARHEELCEHEQSPHPIADKAQRIINDHKQDTPLDDNFEITDEDLRNFLHNERE